LEPTPGKWAERPIYSGFWNFRFAKASRGLEASSGIVEESSCSKDTDVLALYQNLNEGTLLGGTGPTYMKASNLQGIIAYAKANKFGSQLYILHHPNAVAYLSKESAVVASSGSASVPEGWSQDLLSNFWSGLRPMNNVPIFEDGNITEDSGGDGIGVIADKSAMAALTSVDTRTERQRDASLRATEVVMTADYGVFELDDTRGADFGRVSPGFEPSDLTNDFSVCGISILLLAREPLKRRLSGMCSWSWRVVIEDHHPAICSARLTSLLSTMTASRNTWTVLVSV